VGSSFPLTHVATVTTKYCVRAVGVREIKNRLSKYLREVRAGESILVTDHGRVVATLGPPPVFVASHRESEQEALERLARAGVVRPASREMESARAPALPRPAKPIDAAAILADVRGDRQGS
jgi:antitoxin (DNA-binding transcriptional repressor) of toxin-antitoxin stability system